MRMLLFLLITFYSFSLHATFYAEVVFIKGQASQLAPGMTHPVWIKKGDRLKEDTSILTRDKSVLKLKVLSDGSHIVLGPDSKVVLSKLKPQSGSIVGLLTGTLRAVVNKNEKNDKKEKDDKAKFYIKTRTAALGVRGTEFMVVVNEANKVTSLVTLEGEVAMAKIDEHAHLTSNVEDVVSQAVDNEEATVVTKGRASTAYQHKEDVTVPQKVNPAQLVALKENKNLEVVDTPTDTVKSMELSDEKVAELYAPEESGVEVRSDEVPQNGGFVDLKSAIFIPSTQDKIADVGSVDVKTGQYIPAEGVELDVKKGFVAKENDDESKKKAEELNKAVEYVPLPDNFAPGHDLPAVEEKSTATTFNKRTYSLWLGIHTGESEVFDTVNRNKPSNFKADGAHLGFNLDWLRSRFISYQLNLYLHSLRYDDNNIQNKAGDNKDKEDMALDAHIGARYHFIGGFKGGVLLGIAEHQIPVVNLNNELRTSLRSETVSAPEVAFEFILPMMDKWELGGKYRSIFSKGNGDLKHDGGKAVELTIDRGFGESMRHHLRGDLLLKELGVGDNTVKTTLAGLSYRIVF